MAGRYLKQVIVIPRSLHMPTGKLAAMAAHAAMTFLVAKLRGGGNRGWATSGTHHLPLTEEEARWLTELDPGLEDAGQASFAKIVCSVADVDELLAVEAAAKAAGLSVHRVVDSGHSHNKMGDLAAVAIGPDWPEKLEPVTGALKVYR